MYGTLIPYGKRCLVLKSQLPRLGNLGYDDRDQFRIRWSRAFYVEEEGFSLGWEDYVYR